MGWTQLGVDFQENVNSNGSVVNYKSWLLPTSGLYIDIQPEVCTTCDKGMQSLPAPASQAGQ